MNQITQITDDPKQSMILILPDGSSTEVHIEYKTMQQGWFISSLIYKTFIVQGLRIVTSPNMLYQFKNQIPFGLACFVQQDDEPTQLQDFSSGRATLFLLDSVDLAAFEGLLVG